MSRIYDALKRAAEQAKSREALGEPRPVEEEAAPPLDALYSAVRDEAAVAAAIPALARPKPLLEPSRDPPKPRPAERVISAEPSAPERLATYRDQVREALRAKLALEREEKAQEDQHLFEGAWLTAEQIHRLRRRLTWRALGILIQLLLLFLVMGFMNVALLWLINLAVPS